MSFACVSAILISAFSRAGIGDAREVRAGRDLLADVDRHQLQHAGEPGAHVQLVALPLLQLQHGPRLIDARLLHGDLRAARFGARRQLFLRDVAADRQLFGVELRLPQHQRRDQLILGQRLVHLRLHARLVVVGLDARGGRLLLQEIVLHLHAEIGQRGFGRLQLELGVLHFLFELRVGQLEDHAVGRDRACPAAAESARRAPASSPESSGCLRARACRGRAPAGPSARA